jgi:hypothetical protein
MFSMTEPSADNRFYNDILDEILFRDPPNGARLIEVTNGITKKVEVVTFSDGSRLAISAQVPLPPLADMTPKRVFFIKPNGEKGEKLDDGSNEAMELAGQSLAMRFLAWISRELDSLPESKKVSCTACCGNGRCLCCNGKGCLNCDNSGRCVECDGRGVIPKE